MVVIMNLMLLMFVWLRRFSVQKVQKVSTPKLKFHDPESLHVTIAIIIVVLKPRCLFI